MPSKLSYPSTFLFRMKHILFDFLWRSNANILLVKILNYFFNLHQCIKNLFVVLAGWIQVVKGEMVIFRGPRVKVLVG